MTVMLKRLLASFRMRLVAGSLLWTGGLLYIAHVTSVLLFIGPGAFREPARPGLMLVLSFALMLGGLLIVRSGMNAFTDLRRRLADVHAGRERAVLGAYPTEVQPLVDDLNALLENRDRRVRDAVAKAGDLAHGLKTPLAVLGQEAERAEAAGQPELAEVLSQQVTRMLRQVDYHLAHARAAASGATLGARCSVAESAHGLARTLERLHARRGLMIEVDVAVDHTIRGQREDLDEMLGNLLDNACKWARTRVALAATDGNAGIVVTVDDDGPGLAESMRKVVLERGVRADEAAPGTGFGLAIVSELAALYGGSIVLEASPLGGLRARLQLPAATAVVPRA